MADTNRQLPCLLGLTGAVGVGKTTVMAAISRRLSAIGRPHALVDMDCLRACYPAPADDPFQLALGLQNLAAVWTNYRAAGATCLIIADIVESPDDAAAYQNAVPDAALVIVRLTAPVPTLWQRLEQREAGASLEWHKQRALELSTLMEARGIGDLLVNTDEKDADTVADEVLRALF